MGKEAWSETDQVQKLLQHYDYGSTRDPWAKGMWPWLAGVRDLIIYVCPASSGLLTALRPTHLRLLIVSSVTLNHSMNVSLKGTQIWKGKGKGKGKVKGKSHCTGGATCTGESIADSYKWTTIDIY